MAPTRSVFDPASFTWESIAAREYKDGASAGRGMAWKGIARRTLAAADELPAAFEVRYFELEPGGYSSLERHRHAHFVVAIRGRGRALVGSELVELAPFDTVHVAPMAPHRWVNEGAALARSDPRSRVRARAPTPGSPARRGGGQPSA